MTNDIPIAEAMTSGEPPSQEEMGDEVQRAPNTWRDLLSIVAWTILADLLIFRALGLSGPAVFFALAPMLFLIRINGRPRQKSVLVIVALLLLLSLRTAWMGSWLNVVSGVTLIIALAMACSGHAPLVLEGIMFGARAMVDGLLVLSGWKTEAPVAHYAEPVHAEPVHAEPAHAGTPGDATPAAEPAWARTAKRLRNLSAAFLMPVAAAIVFGLIFVFANPDLVGWFTDAVSQVWDIAWNWISRISIFEIPFCIAALLLGAGLLRPYLPMPQFGPKQSLVQTPGNAQADFYAAYRNTLVTLIVLFGVYLSFEFITLWRREFPAGFYYAGYAHQGAAWLTLALALATGLLSLIFSGKVLQDPRLGGLRKLTWVWSGLNFLLAIAVYNRLMIYVGYNGMTRMRTVGFFGITLVVIGFALVLVKIARNRGFWWLIRGQLIALVLTVIAYGLFPVDWVAHKYNASRVASGYLHPSVMIAVKQINDEGIVPLLSLTEVEDPIIREGVLAILAEREHKIRRSSEDSKWHWTRYQAATDSLYPQLEANQEKWKHYVRDWKARRSAINQFRDYAMQWY